MKKIILSIMVLTALASCQKSEEQSPEDGSSSEVVFTSAISTRATGTSWDDGDKIGVFMYNSGATDIYSNSENVPYTTSGGESATFASSTPLIYPEQGEMDFVTYYPFVKYISDGVIALNTADQSSTEKVKAQDFMVARAVSCNKNNPPLLSFTRKMSKIVINVDRKDSEADAVLSDILLKGVKIDGTLAISNSDNADVVEGEITSNIELFFNETSSAIEAIIIPQADMSAKLSLLIDGKPFLATISGTFAKNTQYNYNLSLGIDEVAFTAGSISDWDEVESGEMETIREIVCSASQIDINNIPASDIWTITDEGDITAGIMQGVKDAINYVYDNDDCTIKIKLPNATYIGDDVFNHCYGLAAIELPKVVHIDNNAFYYCRELTTIEMPNAEFIGEEAFYSCMSLSTLKLTTKEHIYCGYNVLKRVDTYNVTLYVSRENANIDLLTDGTYQFKDVIYVD